MKYDLYKQKNWVFLSIFYFFTVLVGFLILDDYGNSYRGKIS